GIFKPPNWPVPLSEYASAECIEVRTDVPFTIGSFTVTAFSADHPDNTVSYHITDGHKTCVHLLDSEIAGIRQESYDILLNHCRGADIVVSDAAYSVKDYPKYVGWGHSTIEDGIRLANDSGCKKMLFAHFSQSYDDDELDSWEKYFAGDKGRFIMAYDGLELTI
ncbi:MAG: MBL fold metallo-hydrolase, partial [Defluviitaleaceae bacterium]|nr:MBL fold metallo-hydrolase [Defluviitaleaceae bacterium]